MKGGIMKKNVVMIFVTMALVSIAAISAKDVPGSKDHPVLPRYPGSRITHYSEKNFDALDILSCPSETEQIIVKDSKKQKYEGKVTKIQYALPKERSAYEVFKNYEAAVENAGFTILCEGKAKDVRHFLDQEEGFWEIKLYTSENPKNHFYLSARNPAKDILLFVYTGEGFSGRPPVAAVGIVELKKMETGLITAKDMKSDLDLAGHVALYGIYFDFDKAVIKPGSEPAIKEIAKLLKENPEMKIYVVGHTDNTGNFRYNMDLSKKRAEAVVDELIRVHGISAGRLSAFGAGPLCPVASNKTEKGRARNRRVEIVEQ